MDPKEKKVKEEELNVEETQNGADEQPQNEQAEDATPLTHEEELEKELEKAQEEIEEQKDKYLRLSAEFDNYRKRTMKEKAELILNGGEKSLSSILPVVDDFERAIKTMETATDVNAVKEGVELIYNKFMAVLAQNGVKVIETKDQPLQQCCTNFLFCLHLQRYFIGVKNIGHSGFVHLPRMGSVSKF